MRIAVLSGGVGAARFLRGLVAAVPATSVTAIVNTGDDTEVHGLSVSPDLDTVVYTLAGAIDPGRGWGLADETWRSMEALERYARIRPPGSSAAPTWFNLGDQDLATHFYRTARLAEGATLTEVSDEIRRAWDLDVAVLPMTDDRLRTYITLAESGEEVPFQDYFVRRRHAEPVSAIRFGHDGATPSVEVSGALDAANVILIAPSNPLVSIGPIRALTGIDDLLAERRDQVAAVSPIVGGAALKGPADRMLLELGLEPSVTGVAELYAPVAGTLVIDPADSEHADRVRRAGLNCVVEPSVMSSLERARSLAEACLAAVG